MTESPMWVCAFTKHGRLLLQRRWYFLQYFYYAVLYSNITVNCSKSSPDIIVPLRVCSMCYYLIFRCILFAAITSRIRPGNPNPDFFVCDGVTVEWPGSQWCCCRYRCCLLYSRSRLYPTFGRISIHKSTMRSCK